MSDVTVVAAGDDVTLATIAALAERIWRQHYPGIISPAQIDYMLARGYALSTLREDLAARVRYDLARVDGEPAAFAAHGPDPVHTDTLWLHKLYVDAAHRRHGLARRLLARALAHARERSADYLRLRVNRDNRDAVAAYRRLGFRIEASDVKDIGGGFVMDDYLMVRAAVDDGHSSGE